MELTTLQYHQNLYNTKKDIVPLANWQGKKHKLMNGEVSRKRESRNPNLKHLAVCFTEVSEFAKISAGRGLGEERNVKCQLLTVASR